MNDTTPATVDRPPARAAAPPERPDKARGSIVWGMERFGLVGLLGVVVVVFSVLRPGTFATIGNWQVISVTQSVLIVTAVALIVPLMAGRFDVSVGANLGLCAIVCSALMAHYGQSLPVAILCALLVGALVGTVNGIVVSYLGVNSIIATLGTATIIGGLVSAYTNGVPITTGISSALADLSATTVARIPVLFILAITLAVVVWFLLTQTPYGRELTAIGSNQRAAQLVGIQVRRHVMLSFVASGFLAGLGGVLQIAASGSGDPSVGGIAFIVPALAAVFLGATTWDPGRYNVPGAVIGLLFVSSVVSGLALMGVRPWVGDVVNGGAVVLAIVLSAQFRRKRSGELEIGT